MKKARQLTPFGLAVKKALLDEQVTQKDFCTRLGIPVNRFTEILYGLRPGTRYRGQIANALGLEDNETLSIEYTRSDLRRDESGTSTNR